MNEENRMLNRGLSEGRKYFAKNKNQFLAFLSQLLPQAIISSIKLLRKPQPNLGFLRFFFANGNLISKIFFGASRIGFRVIGSDAAAGIEELTN